MLGAAGVWFGFPLADPIVGLGITLAIFSIVWQSSKSVLTRMLDGIDPDIIRQINHAADHVPGLEVQETKARWLGHRLHADIVVGVDPTVSVAEASGMAERLRTILHDHLPALDNAAITFVK